MSEKELVATPRYDTSGVALEVVQHLIRLTKQGVLTWEASINRDTHSPSHLLPINADQYTYTAIACGGVRIVLRCTSANAYWLALGSSGMSIVRVLADKDWKPHALRIDPLEAAVREPLDVLLAVIKDRTASLVGESRILSLQGFVEELSAMGEEEGSCESADI